VLALQEVVEIGWREPETAVRTHSMSMAFRRFATNLSDDETKLVVNDGNTPYGTCPSGTIPPTPAGASRVGSGAVGRIATVSKSAAPAEVSHGRERR
jgi:hypothetical protein